MFKYYALFVVLHLVLPRCAVGLDAQIADNEIISFIIDCFQNVHMDQGNYNKGIIEIPISDLQTQLTHCKPLSKFITQEELKFCKFMKQNSQEKIKSAFTCDHSKKNESLAEAIKCNNEYELQILSKKEEMEVLKGDALTIALNLMQTNCHVKSLQSDFSALKTIIDNKDAEILKLKSVIKRTELELNKYILNLTACVDKPASELQSMLTNCEKQRDELNTKMAEEMRQMKIKEERISNLENELLMCNAQSSYVLIKLAHKLREIEKRLRELRAKTADTIRLTEQKVTFQLLQKEDTIKILQKNLQSCTAKFPPPKPFVPIRRFPRNCSRSEGIQGVKVPDAETFPILCYKDTDKTDWMVIQRRLDGSVNFYRGWEEYKNGFGELSGEFFLGLEKLHIITTTEAHKLTVMLIDLQDRKYFARYDDFRIGNLQSDYTLEALGRYSGSIGDAMRGSENKKFTTFDRNNHDGAIQDTEFNCANVTHGAWWYAHRFCGKSNLNGRYYNESPEVRSVLWSDGNTRIYFKTIYMMIRPKY